MDGSDEMSCKVVKEVEDKVLDVFLGLSRERGGNGDNAGQLGIVYRLCIVEEYTNEFLGPLGLFWCQGVF